MLVCADGQVKPVCRRSFGIVAIAAAYGLSCHVHTGYLYVPAGLLWLSCSKTTGGDLVVGVVLRAVTSYMSMRWWMMNGWYRLKPAIGRSLGLAYRR